MSTLKRRKASPRHKIKKRRPLSDPSEHSIQAKLIGLLPPLLKPGIVVLSIPNGGLRHPLVALKLKAEGLVPGSPDLVFALPKGRVAWLEMKCQSGRLSDVQHGMKAKLQRLDHLWGMADSVDAALEVLDTMGILKSNWREMY